MVSPEFRPHSRFIDLCPPRTIRLPFIQHFQFCGWYQKICCSIGLPYWWKFINVNLNLPVLYQSELLADMNGRRDCSLVLATITAYLVPNQTRRGAMRSKKDSILKMVVLSVWIVLARSRRFSKNPVGVLCEWALLAWGQYSVLRPCVVLSTQGWELRHRPLR